MNYAQVFQVELGSQALVGGDGLTLSSSSVQNSVQLTGSLLGAQFALETTNQFASRIQEAFETSGANFVPSMQFNLNLPGPIYEQDRFKYFDDVFNVTGLVEVGTGGFASGPIDEGTAGPPIAPQDNDDEGGGIMSGISLIVILALGGFVLLVLLFAGIACAIIRRSRKRGQSQDPYAEDDFHMSKEETERRERRQRKREQKLREQQNKGAAPHSPLNTTSRSASNASTETMDSIFSNDSDVEQGATSYPPGWLSAEEYERELEQNSRVAQAAQASARNHTSNPSQRQHPFYTAPPSPRRQMNSDPSYQQQPNATSFDPSATYAMSDLSQMSIGKLKKILKDNDIEYDPKDIVEKGDLIRIMVRSQKFHIESEVVDVRRTPSPTRMIRRGSQGPMPRRGSQGPVSAQHTMPRRGSQGPVPQQQLPAPQMARRGSQGPVLQQQSFQGPPPPVMVRRGSQGPMPAQYDGMVRRGSQGPVLPQPYGHDEHMMQRRGSQGPMPQPYGQGPSPMMQRRGSQGPVPLQPGQVPVSMIQRRGSQGPEPQQYGQIPPQQWNQAPPAMQRRGSQGPIDHPPPVQEQKKKHKAKSSKKHSQKKSKSKSKTKTKKHHKQVSNEEDLQTLKAPPQPAQASRRGSLVAAFGWSRGEAPPVQQPPEQQGNPVYSQNVAETSVLSRRGSLVAAFGWSRQAGTDTQENEAARQCATTAAWAAVSTTHAANASYCTNR